MSYPLEKVDFPTVTLCPVSPDSDRWGLAVKLFDYLEVHCVKPLFPINSQNPQETISKFQQIRKECGNFTENQEIIQTILFNATRCLMKKWMSKLENTPFEEWRGISGVPIPPIQSFENVAKDENLTKGILNAMEEMKKSLQFIEKDRLTPLIQLITPPPAPPPLPPPPPPPPPFSVPKTSVPFSQNYLLKSKDKSQSSSQYLAQSAKENEEIDSCDDLCSKRALKMAMEYTLLYITMDYRERSAGQSLAYFRRLIGQGTCSSTSSFLLNDWSLVPLQVSDKNKKPTELEMKINTVMEKITYHISGGRLKNVSILDLPGFGSMTDFNRRLSKEPTNMALLKQWQENLDSGIPNPFEDLFNEHYDLGSMWEKYMANPKETPFPPKMKSHNIFNFTKFILEDFETFLFAIKESHLTTQESNKDYSLRNIAKEIFTSLNTGKSFSEALILASTNAQYDKRLFIELQVQYMKTTSLEHVVYINCFELSIQKQKNNL